MRVHEKCILLGHLNHSQQQWQFTITAVRPPKQEDETFYLHEQWKKGDPGYFVLCRISYYAKQWCMEECTWQGVFCLHSIQSLTFFHCSTNRRQDKRHQFTPGNARPFPPQCHWNPRWRNPRVSTGRPVVSFIDRREDIAEDHKVGPLSTIVIHMEFYFTP